MRICHLIHTSATLLRHSTSTLEHFNVSIHSWQMANTKACALINGWHDYCSATIYSVTDKNMKRLQHDQNFSTRVVCHAPFRSSTTRLLRSLHWLPVERRTHFKISLTTQKIRLNCQPTYLAEFVKDYRETCDLRFNENSLLAVPPTKTTKTKLANRAFRVAAPTIWNDLLPAIRSSSLAAGLQCLLKTHLFKNAFEWSYCAKSTPDSLLNCFNIRKLIYGMYTSVIIIMIIIKWNATHAFYCINNDSMASSSKELFKRFWWSQVASSMLFGSVIHRCRLLVADNCLSQTNARRWRSSVASTK